MHGGRAVFLLERYDGSESKAEKCINIPRYGKMKYTISKEIA